MHFNNNNNNDPICLTNKDNTCVHYGLTLGRRDALSMSDLTTFSSINLSTCFPVFLPVCLSVSLVAFVDVKSRILLIIFCMEFFVDMLDISGCLSHLVYN